MHVSSVVVLKSCKPPWCVVQVCSMIQGVTTVVVFSQRYRLVFSQRYRSTGVTTLDLLLTLVACRGGEPPFLVVVVALKGRHHLRLDAS